MLLLSAERPSTFRVIDDYIRPCFVQTDDAIISPETPTAALRSKNKSGSRVFHGFVVGEQMDVKHAAKRLESAAASSSRSQEPSDAVATVTNPAFL